MIWGHIGGSFKPQEQEERIVSLFWRGTPNFPNRVDIIYFLSSLFHTTATPTLLLSYSTHYSSVLHTTN
jgi:hypothetical protein